MKKETKTQTHAKTLSKARQARGKNRKKAQATASEQKPVIQS